MVFIRTKLRMSCLLDKLGVAITRKTTGNIRMVAILLLLWLSPKSTIVHLPQNSRRKLCVSGGRGLDSYSDEPTS